MSKKFYGVKTQSGSWYLLAETQHIIGQSTWYIYWNGEAIQFNSLGGLNPMNGEHKIMQIISDVKGKTIEHKRGNTSAIVEYIEFK